MKKLLSVILLTAVVMSMAVIGTSAAEIYMQDDFSGDAINWDNWLDEGTKFFVEDGKLQGYKDAVVQQSAYGNPDIGKEDGKNRDWATFAAEVDVRIVDTDSPGANQTVALWVRAYGDDFMDGENAGEIYNVGYDHTNSAYVIGRDTVEATSDNAIVVVPTEQWQDGADAPFHKIGIKVEANGMISLWADGAKVAEVDTNDAAATGSTESIYTMGTYHTPLLLVNRNNYVQFDKVVVASPDYYTENVPVDPTTPDNPDNPGTSGDPSNPVNPSNPGTPSNPSDPSTPGNSGNSANPSNPSTPNGGANATDTNRNQNNAASTGDALYVAVAIAVAALGCAVVVKKVNVK